MTKLHLSGDSSDEPRRKEADAGAKSITALVKELSVQKFQCSELEVKSRKYIENKQARFRDLTRGDSDGAC